uniref:UBA domain-containing protein n=1 Tax=Ciona savignyi TaxID=51511 RepID=H2YMT8_CIOSA
MSEQMTMDELLSHLMLMGFNPEDCHEAVSCGKLSAQDAVEWILSGKPRTSSSAHLVLPKQIIKAHDKSESSHSNSGISDGPQCPSYQASKPNEPPVVHSRFAESRDARVQFLNNKRIRLEHDVKKEKMNKKMEKEAILKEIECDRKAKRELKQNPDTSVAMPTTSTAPSGQHATCLIQIRLPNGQNVRHEFQSQQTISHVV